MPRPPALKVAVAAALLTALAGAAHAQEPRPATLDTSLLAETEEVSFTYAWRFHPGDDPSWASPDLDDSGWQPLEPQMLPGKLPPAGWPGVGWFRRHILIPAALQGVPLAARIVTVGSAELYIDGTLLAATGPFVPDARPDIPASTHGPWPLKLSARPDHVFAVRYACAALPASAPPGTGLGFTVTITATGEVARTRAAMARWNATMLAALVTVLIFVSLLHGALYWFYPRRKENLFFSLNMAVFALLVLRDVGGVATPTPAWTPLLGRVVSPLPPLAILLGLLSYYAWRTQPYPREWKAFVICGVALMPVVAFAPDPYSTLAWCIYFVAMVIDVIHVEVSGRTVAREGAMILLTGMVVLAGFIGLQVLINFNLVPPIAGLRQVWVFGVFASVSTISLFFARTFARTSTGLERRLAEVQALSAQLLEQERATHANELRTRLLEAENARTTSELEAARKLQLSMLPTFVPEVPGLEVAVAMTTASEVGGDYYDFRIGPDGSLVVAIGDATGHGVAAGIMVTAVKTLFAALARETDLAASLGQCDRILGGLHLPHLHMCLTLARITPVSITFSSAGMPPVLIHRKASGAIEELVVAGLPLGSRVAPSYREHRAALAAGDTVLLATDGFHEVLDPDGRALGFEDAAVAFRQAAGASASEVLGRLDAAVKAWRREREQTDDITFVAVRVMP